MEFPTLMGSVGGWVFVLDVTRCGSVKNSIRMDSEWTMTRILKRTYLGFGYGTEVVLLL